MTGRPTRDVAADDGRWRAVEAWRSEGGSRLVYFLPLDGEATAAGREGADPDGDTRPAEVAADDRRDRRAVLEGDETLPGLSSDDLAARLEGGEPLTGTEWRFRASDGRQWLAQSVGPVWAEGGVAAGLTGLLFTSLEGEPERFRVEDGRPPSSGRPDLAARWREASRDAGDPADG